MLMNDAIEKFMILVVSDLSEGTQRYYHEKIPIIKRYLGNVDIDTIDKFTIADFTIKQRERRPGISNRTLNYYRDIIVRIIKTVSGRELDINKLTTQKATPKKVDDSIIDTIMDYYLSDLNKYSNHKYYLILKLFLDTGVRIRELVNIKLDNINYQLRAIYLDTTKTKVHRFVFFTKETEILILSYINKYNVNGEYLFPRKDGTGHANGADVAKKLYLLQHRLGIKKSISPHKWRHTFAKKYLRSGGDLSSLQQLLGHTELTTTEIYTKFDDEDLKEIYDKVMKGKNRK
jgi:site-specific recombinase XerD